MCRRILVLVLAALCSGALAAAPDVRPLGIVLDDASAVTRAKVTEGIGRLGGRIVHAFDDILVAELPPGREFSAYRIGGVKEIALNAMSPGGRRAGEVPAGRAAWNAIAASEGAIDVRDVVAPVESDALESPAVTQDEVNASRGTAPVPGKRLAGASASTFTTPAAPLGASDLTTSEFLAGAISVNVILVESDGTIDPQTENWTSDRESDVVSRIAQALEWVRLQEPQASIRFVYHVIAGRTDARARTGYEPIRRSADPTGTTGEDLWVKQILAKLGYPTGDRFARSRAFAADTRRADGTDWAVNVFVVDSLVDGDGKFADGRFAYTWVGGPHLVMTYDNGPWGISRMDMVLRHEFLHAFYAFDEYTTSTCSCTDHRGYLDGPNANCDACNPIASSCVMISNGDAMCDATRRQIGWSDLDGDGKIDVIGQPPATFIEPISGPVCTVPVLEGVSTVVAATNRNTYGGTAHPSISVNRITAIEVSADGAPWTALDGAATLPVQRTNFSAPLSFLAPGPHQLLARTVDDFGNTDAAPEQAQFVLHGAMSAVTDSVRLDRSGSGVAMSWQPCTEATAYRVYRSDNPGGQASVVAETAAAAWSDPSAGSGYYVVRPVDACGSEQ